MMKEKISGLHIFYIPEIFPASVMDEGQQKESEIMTVAKKRRDITHLV